MKKYPYVEIVNGRRIEYVSPARYYSTNLETGVTKIGDTFCTWEDWEDAEFTNETNTEDTECLTKSGEILNPFKAEYDENGKEIFIPKTK